MRQNEAFRTSSKNSKTYDGPVVWGRGRQNGECRRERESREADDHALSRLFSTGLTCETTASEADIPYVVITQNTWGTRKYVNERA